MPLWKVSFNRTILELKLKGKDNQEVQGILQSYHTGIEIPLSGTYAAGYGTFNRTILELKSYYRKPGTSIRVAFNRTILELKFYKLSGSSLGKLPSIVPYWN